MSFHSQLRSAFALCIALTILVLSLGWTAVQRITNEFEQAMQTNRRLDAILRQLDVIQEQLVATSALNRLDDAAGLLDRLEGILTSLPFSDQRDQERQLIKGMIRDFRSGLELYARHAKQSQAQWSRVTVESERLLRETDGLSSSGSQTVAAVWRRLLDVHQAWSLMEGKTLHANHETWRGTLEALARESRELGRRLEAAGDPLTAFRLVRSVSVYCMAFEQFLLSRATMLTTGQAMNRKWRRLEGGIQNFMAKGPDETRSPIGTSAWKWLLVALIAVGMGILLSYALTGIVSRPVDILKTVAGQIAAGNLDVSIPDQETREFQELADSLGQMAQELRQSFEDLRLADARIRQREAELTALIDASSDLIYLKDAGLRYRVVNAAHATFCGSTAAAMIGRTDSEILTASSADWFEPSDQEALETGEKAARVQFNGRFFHFMKRRVSDDQGQACGVAAVIRDVTEERRLEEASREQEKLQAIGRLAGGVAHDFNNQLTVIGGLASLILNHNQISESGRELGARIFRAAQRSAELTSQLLTFSRQGVNQVELVDLHILLEELHAILSRTLEKVEVSLACQAERCLVHAESTLLQNGLLNLAFNARDAMPAGGKLHFSTRIRRVNESGPSGKDMLDLAAGDYIVVEVTDSGEGMDEDTRSRIFEPFFTTKEIGKGVGLGLASVYGMVRSLGGGMACESTPGHGTCFRIHLPLAEGVAGIATTGRKHGQEPEIPAASVLVIDDEEVVGETLGAMIETLGHTCRVFSDGEEAIAWYQGNPGKTDLVLVDMVMPRIDGLEVFRRLRAIDPVCRVLCMSGYSNPADLQSIQDEGAVGFLPKPIELAGIEQAFNEVLTHQSPASPQALSE